MKSTIVPTIGVVIRDTPGVSVKEVLQKSKKDSHMLHASSLGDRVGSQPKVLDESQDKTTGTNEGTGTKPRLPNVSKDHSESENESWGDSKDDDRNDDVSDDVSKGDDDDVDSDGDGDNDASDNESIDLNKEENPNLTLKDGEEEETQDDEYIHTSDSYASIDEETNDDYREFDEEEYDELYKDVNMTSNVVEHEKEGEGDAEMTDSAQEDVSQENKFLNLDNVPPADNEVTSMMNVKVSHEESSIQAPPLLIIPAMAIPITFTVAATTVPSKITPITPIPQMSTPTPVPTTEPTTSSIPVLPDFASLFRFDQRVTRIGFATQIALQSYTTEFEKKAQVEKEKYINIIEKSVKEIIKDEVKSQLPQILPKEISDFATLVIQSTINESLENVILAKSSSQSQSTYEAAPSLTEFELKKIMLDKLEKSKLYRAAEQHRDLHDALVKSYQLDKDLFDSYGKAYSLNKGREDKNKDEDPPAGSDQGLKKRPPTLDPDWNAGKQVDFRPPYTWISQIAKVEKPSLTFNELISTLIDFSAYVMHNLKIDNLTQHHLVGPTFNLLKGTCKSRVELDYHLEECYKGVNDRLDWYNPEGHEYPFDLSKPLPLVKD
ncbi:hypothetical protein Tco_0518924 [Tanacetum coccineum]